MNLKNNINFKEEFHFHKSITKKRIGHQQVNRLKNLEKYKIYLLIYNHF